MSIKDDQRHLFTVTHRAGFVVTHGHGSCLIDEDGNCYIDCWNDEGVASLGYNTPVLRSAVASFMESARPHRTPRALVSRTRSDYAKRVCRLMGYPDGRVFFANSGAEANETAIKLARRWQHFHGDRNKMGVVTIEGNFHGRTAFAMACSDASASPYHKEGYGPMPAMFGTLRPVHDADTDTWDFIQILTPGDDTNLEMDQIGAVNLAPVLGNNVVHTYPPSFFKALRKWCDDHGALLIYDDVQAGAGRTGYYSSWQHPNIGVRPDILCIGKGIALGWPMSLVLADDRIAQAITPGSHFNSMAGSEWVCHMSNTLLDWLEDGGLARIRLVGEQIKSDLKGLGWIKSVDGYGFMLAFTPDWNGYNGQQLCAAAHQEGLLIMTWRDFGPVRFNPPLNISPDDMASSILMLDRAHKRVTGG